MEWTCSEGGGVLAEMLNDRLSEFVASLMEHAS